jgi:two-component system chemotaxis sensor kinase CheA
MDRGTIDFEALRALLGRIGLELAFVAPDTAGGGALAALLAEWSDAVRDAPPGLVVQAEAARARARAERIGVEASSWFGAWHPWMQEAITCWERGYDLPPLPAMLADAAPVAPVAGDRPLPVEPAAAVVPHRAPAVRQATVWDAPGGRQEVGVLPAGIDMELVRLFCAEAEDLVRDVEQGVLTLERNPDDAETMATVFRAFHTLKGNAAVLKLVELQGLAHEIESLLDAARRGDLRITSEAIDIVLAGADVFSRFLAEAGRQADGFDVGRTIALPIPALLDAARTLATSRGTPPPPSVSSADASDATAPPAPAVAPDADVGPSATVTTATSTGATAVVTPREPSPAGASAVSGSVRVDTRKLDALVDLVGELVIAESMVVDGTAAVRSGDERLARSLARLHGITSELQRTAMTLRMVPIRGTFQKMTRLVRDAAGRLGKDIRLVLEGEETELDRTVVEEIGDPLIHMIRNAIDHGIEPPAERIAAGKSPQGQVTLRAYHRGGFVVIEISDDGRGLDPTRIRARAVERGIVPPDATLEPREILDLIFAPGFSTAEVVTDLSGRGVGMDVARRNIERIRGSIQIESQPGRGTIFTISIPLTLAIIEGLLAAVGDQRYVIPTLAVRESFRPQAGAVSTVHGRGEVVRVRDSLVPILRLSRLFGVAGAVEDPEEGILVVVDAGHDVRCLLVDALVGKQEVVIKSLGETFAGHTGFSGAAILGDGQVGLILDTAALVRRRAHLTETAA